MHASCVITSAPAAEPDTSNTTSAPAPPVRVEDRRGQVGGGGVDDVEAELRGELPAERAHLADGHRRSSLSRDEADQQADRPAADHDDRLAGGHLAAANVVARNRQRLDERGPSQVDGGREPVEREGGHRPGALERARGVDAEELEVAADVAHALVGGRLAARVERPHDDVLADREAVDARAELGNRPRHLVPDDLRHPHAVVHVAVRDVEIRAADAAEPDVEPDLARPRRDHLAFPEREPPRALVVHGRHCVSTPSASSMCLSHCSPSER